MADILVMGIEPPKYGDIRIVLDKDGKVYEDDGHFSTEIGEWKRLPFHGRLGDLDLVEGWMRKKHKDNDCPFDIDAFILALRKIPTVVEASE